MKAMCARETCWRLSDTMTHQTTSPNGRILILNQLLSTIVYIAMHPKCILAVSEGLIQPKFESTDSIGAALGIKHSPGYPLLLCREHYNTVYKHFHPQTTCASCGASSRRGTSFSHHSPEAHAVSLHLQETTGSTIIIHPGDLLCNTCY